MVFRTNLQRLARWHRQATAGRAVCPAKSGTNDHLGGRSRPHRSIGVALISTVLLLAVPGGGQVQAAGGGHPEQAKRVPPYDVGCVMIPTPGPDQCKVWDEAREGILRGGRVPMITTTYSWPPFPQLTTYDYTTVTGIYLDIPRTSSIRVSAMLRMTQPVDVPPELSVVACIGVVPPPSDIWSDTGFGGFDCQLLRSGGRRTQITTEFDDSVWKRRFEPGRYTFFVHLRGTDGIAPLDSPSEVLVESISYEATAVRR